MTNEKKELQNQMIVKAFIEVAADYVQQGNNIEESQNYAQFAAIAWNISLFPEKKIAEQLELVTQDYEKLNPGVIQADLLKHDLQLLVDKKLKRYPAMKHTITKLGLEENEDDYYFKIETVPFVRD